MRTVRRPSAHRSSFFGVFLALLFAALSIFLAPCQAIAAETSADMYRLYNHWTGEHFYTASATERDGLVAVGWTDEGLGWVAPTSGDPVYRLYNPYVAGGDHHYTLSAAEVLSRFLRTFRQPHSPALRCGYPSSSVTSR